MDLDHEQNLPGAEYGSAWTTTPSFGPNEGKLEELYMEALQNSPDCVYPDDPTNYTIKGIWDKSAIINFALGIKDSYSNSKPEPRSIVNVKVRDGLI